MVKLHKFLKDHSSLILTIIGSVGVFTSVGLAIKATPEAMELIDEEEKEKEEKLTPLEVIKVSWKPYIPTGISCLATLSCILGAHCLNMKTQASLMSAYAFLQNSYNEFTEKTKELYGDESLNNIRSLIAQDHYTEPIDLDNDEQLFFDFSTGKYFNTTFTKLFAAENFLNCQLAGVGYVTLNDFYRELNVEPLSYGDKVGWESDGNYKELIFEHQLTVLEDGLECHIITVNIPPSC